MNITTQATPPIRVGTTPSTSAPTEESATFVVIPEMTVTTEWSGRPIAVHFSATIKLATGDSWNAAIFVDGVEWAPSRRSIDFFGGSLLGLTPARVDALPMVISTFLLSVTPGTHTIDVRWKRNAGTATLVGLERSLFAIEVSMS